MKCPYCDKQAIPPLCEYCKAAIEPVKAKTEAPKKSESKSNKKGVK